MASEKLKAVLQRELEAQADRGVGLAELLDYLHASNRRFARRNRLSDEQLDELSLWCWVRARSGSEPARPIPAEPEPVAEPEPEPQPLDSLLDRIEVASADPEEEVIVEPVVEQIPDATGPAHDLWAGFRRTPISNRSRSRRQARSASAST
jgi:hypothetical protein